MGVNAEGLGVVLHLIDQMHALRRALAAALESAHERGSIAGSIQPKRGKHDSIGATTALHQKIAVPLLRHG